MRFCLCVSMVDLLVIDLLFFVVGKLLGGPPAESLPLLGHPKVPCVHAQKRPSRRSAVREKRLRGAWEFA